MNGQSWWEMLGHSPCPLSLSPAQHPCPLTPVLTRDNMMRSLRASVSPCFILMRFLSKHFMAYLGDGHRVPAATMSPEQGQHPAPAHSCNVPASHGPCSHDNIPASPLPPNRCHHSSTAGIPQPPKIPGGSLCARAFPLHFSCVRFPAAVDLPEAATADDSVNAKVVHGELEG